MARRQAVKTWLKLQIGGQKWSVYLVPRKSKHLFFDGAYNEGICEYGKSRIFVSNALPVAAREDTLLHELTHALFYVAGARAIIDSDDAEERIVRAMTPILHRLLSDLGFVFPKVPE